jgi:hypothetical protein
VEFVAENDGSGWARRSAIKSSTVRIDLDEEIEDEGIIETFPLAGGGVEETPVVDVVAGGGLPAAAIALCTEDLVLLGPGIVTLSLHLNSQEKEQGQTNNAGKGK